MTHQAVDALEELSARFNGEARWREGRDKAADMTAVLKNLGIRTWKLRLLPPRWRRVILIRVWDKMARPYHPE
jgi:hypothetical protein